MAARQIKINAGSLIFDIENLSGKRVLNSLTREKREKIAGFFFRRIFFCGSTTQSHNFKIVSFLFVGQLHTSANSLFKNLRSSIRYFLSREKTVNTGVFNFDLLLFIKAGEKEKKIIENVSSSAFLTREQNECLKSFSFEILSKVAYFVIRFKDGYFLEDEIERIINKGEVFVSEKCVICLENTPKIGFSNCGHICICEECFKVCSGVCPLCKTVSIISFVSKKK